jgi:hypothetical protein
MNVNGLWKSSEWPMDEQWIADNRSFARDISNFHFRDWLLAGRHSSGGYCFSLLIVLPNARLIKYIARELTA